MKKILEYAKHIKIRWQNYFVFGLIVVAYSYFRSFVTNVPFANALDQILLTIISEVWKFISTPTIFVSIMAFGILFIYKEDIASVIPKIQEFSGGGFKAVFGNPSPSKNSTLSKDDNGDIQIMLLQRLPISYLKCLLELDEKKVSVSNVKEIMESVGLEKSLLDKWKVNNGIKTYYFYYGVITALRRILVPLVMREKITGDDTEFALFSLESTTKEKILKILDKS